MRTAKTAMCLTVIYGLIGAIGDGTACAALSLKSFLTIPLWMAFIPAALAWMAAGIRGLKPESLIGVGALSLVGGPILAAKLISLPTSGSEAMAIAFNSIRQSLAISLAALLPICIVCMLVGVIIRSALEGNLSHISWRFPHR